MNNAVTAIIYLDANTRLPASQTYALYIQDIVWAIQTPDFRHSQMSLYFTSCLVCSHDSTMPFFCDLLQVSEMEVNHAEAGRQHLVASMPVQDTAAASSFHLGLCSSHRRQRREFTRPRVRIEVQARAQTTTSHGDMGYRSVCPDT